MQNSTQSPQLSAEIYNAFSSFLASFSLPPSNRTAENHGFAEIGLLLLDSTGTVIFSDEMATHHCKCGDGLSLVSHTLEIYTSEGRFRGEEIYRLALRSKLGLHFVPRNGKVPLEVRFLQLPLQQLGSGFIICLLRDEEHERSMLLRQLCLKYRLSPSEAQLCFLVRDGYSLSEAAVQLSTSYGAVRARLKRIFEKTGVQRQPDLIRLLLYRSASEMCAPNQA